MGNTLTRDIFREDGFKDYFALDPAHAARDVVQFVSSFRSKMSKFHRNPDVVVLSNMIGVMEHLSENACKFKPYHLKDRSTTTLDLIGDFILGKTGRIQDVLKFYVTGQSEEVSLASEIHFITIVRHDDEVGVVLFFDETAANFAKLYVSVFCPQLDDFDSIGFVSDELPPISDLLGYTKHGHVAFQRFAKDLNQSAPGRLLREGSFVYGERTYEDHEAYVINEICNSGFFPDIESMREFRNFVNSNGFGDGGELSFGTFCMLMVAKNSPEASSLSPEDRLELGLVVLDEAKADTKLIADMKIVADGKEALFAIYAWSCDWTCICNNLFALFKLSIIYKMVETICKTRLLRHVKAANRRLVKRKRERQLRFKEVISRCVGAAIASVKLKISAERRQHLLELEHQREIEEEARRREAIQEERRARAARVYAPRHQANVPGAQQRRHRGQARPPPAEVPAQLKLASQEAAAKHEEELKEQEDRRIALLAEHARIRKIGYDIMNGN